VLGADHPLALLAAYRLGLLLLESDRASEAEPLLKETAERSGRALGARNRQTVLANVGLARAIGAAGRLAEAENALRAVAEVVWDDPTSERGTKAACASALVELYEKRHGIDPAGGHDAGVAEWKARLDSLGPDPASGGE
jgi:hypothetical protein